MCFYYLPAFATAFAARPWRTPFAELSRGFRAWRFGFRGGFPTWTRILNPFMEVFDAAQERIEGPSWDCDTGPRLGPQNENPKKSTYFGISVFQNSKIIGLFRCHWGVLKRLSKRVFAMSSRRLKLYSAKIPKYFFRLSEQPICAHARGMPPFL